jgi:hypothetical protein
MSITYKTDESFFTIIIPPRGAYGFWTFHKWFQENAVAKFRVIRDSEVEEDRLTLTQVDDIYPGIRTIGVVMNPWARIYYAYTQSILNTQSQKMIALRYSGIDFSSFENYVPSLMNCKTIDNKVLPPTTNQIHWVAKDGKLVNNLIRIEQVHADFKPLQEYFCTNSPLEVADFSIDYQPHYSTKNKNLIKKIFKQDIEQFGYSY